MSLASVIARNSRIGPNIDSFTAPSSRTKDTASAPRAASRRPKAKRGDVDTVLAESGSDKSNHAGFVVVAQVENRSLELGFQRNAINLDYAWRSVMQYCAFRGKSRCAGLIRERRHFQGVREAVLAPPCLFLPQSDRGLPQPPAHLPR